MKRVVARHAPLYLSFFFSDEGADDAATCDARRYMYISSAAAKIVVDVNQSQLLFLIFF
jgi:hypothetical protein